MVSWVFRSRSVRGLFISFFFMVWKRGMRVLLKGLWYFIIVCFVIRSCLWSFGSTRFVLIVLFIDSCRLEVGFISV